MTTGKSSESGGRKSDRSGRNNNPAGRNQHSGVMGTARDKPLATAAAAVGAVAAGVFLWSRRNQISDQIGTLSDQIIDWGAALRTSSDPAAARTGSTDENNGQSQTLEGESGRTQVEIAEEALTLKETGTTA